MPAFAHIDDAGFLCTTCPGCGSPSHPSCGSAYSATFVFCRSCALDFARWVERYTASKGRRRGIAFYDYVRR